MVTGRFEGNVWLLPRLCNILNKVGVDLLLSPLDEAPPFEAPPLSEVETIMFSRVLSPSGRCLPLCVNSTKVS